MKLLPVIKWTGSKRALADEIVEYFPKQIDTYYEPFYGGCSVLFNILHKDISIKNFVCSDLNADLIAFFNELKTNPTNVSSEYARRWETLNSFSEIQDRKKYYESVRADYNKNHGVYDFIFLTRTCINGLIRYNRNGEFNSSFHLTRPGINPDTFNSILFDWSSKIKNVEFVCQSYDSIKPNKGDFVFLDPPYANTNSMYFGGIDLNQLWKWIESLPCNYAMSFDGIRGDDDLTYDVPKNLFLYMKNLHGENSSFDRLNKTKKVVHEKLYIKE